MKASAACTALVLCALPAFDVSAQHTAPSRVIDVPKRPPSEAGRPPAATNKPTKIEGSGGAFCQAGFDALTAYLLGERNPTDAPDPALIYNNCLPGDSVVIVRGLATFAAQVCDFSQSVVSVPGSGPLGAQIVCIVGQPRAIRTNR